METRNFNDWVEIIEKHGTEPLLNEMMSMFYAMENKINMSKHNPNHQAGSWNYNGDTNV